MERISSVFSSWWSPTSPSTSSSYSALSSHSSTTTSSSSSPSSSHSSSSLSSTQLQPQPLSTPPSSSTSLTNSSIPSTLQNDQFRRSQQKAHEQQSPIYSTVLPKEIMQRNISEFKRILAPTNSIIVSQQQPHEHGDQSMGLKPVDFNAVDVDQLLREDFKVTTSEYYHELKSQSKNRYIQPLLQDPIFMVSAVGALFCMITGPFPSNGFVRNRLMKGRIAFQAVAFLTMFKHLYSNDKTEERTKPLLQRVDGVFGNQYPFDSEQNDGLVTGPDENSFEDDELNIERID